MTLLFHDACQDPLLVPKPEMASGTPWVSAQTGRDGQANGAARSSGNNNVDYVLPTAAATCVVGCAMKWSALGIAQYLAFMLDGTTVQTVVTVNSSGFLEARRTSAVGTLLGTSSGHTPIAIATWFHLTAKVVLNSAGAGSVILQLNGVTVLTLTGITTAASTASVARIRFQTATSQSMDVDDLYVCDTVDATATQGHALNDFLGDLPIQVSFPTADGDTIQWTPSTGSNWAAVDETPPVTTDNVFTVNSGNRDLYQLGDLTGTVVAVYAVREGLYVAKSDAGSAQIKPVLKENSVVTVDPAQGLATTAGAVYGPLHAVRPSDSAAWTAADVNALQAGQEVA